MTPKWLEWAGRLQSIAQAGLTYSTDKYDLERFEQIKDLSAEILINHSSSEEEKIRMIIEDERGYLTPKIDIRSVVIKDNRILLIREKIDGRWALPGGWADVYNSVSENAARECFEEAGAEVLPGRIIAILTANRHNDPFLLYTTYKIFVECEFVKSEFKENIETYEAAFFALDEIPELSTGRTSMKQINMCFEAHKQKLFETIFD